MPESINDLRRRIIGAAGGILGFAMTGGIPLARATERILTPPQSRGPFYPLQLPLDKDNDLVKVRGRSEIAQGEITHLIGRVIDERGRAIPAARVEIWQCDARGRYHHPWDRRHVPRDPNFQGYGQSTTDSDGAYRFRTIKPIPYPGRAPHIHFAISGPGFETLVTQMYVAGAPENERDFLLNNIADPELRRQVLVPFEKLVHSDAALVANFDIVLAADGRFGK